MERRAAEELAPLGENLLARRAALKADMEGAAALAGRLEEALGKMELKVEEVPESEPPAQAVSRAQEQLAARLVRALRKKMRKNAKKNSEWVCAWDGGAGVRTCAQACLRAWL